MIEDEASAANAPGRACAPDTADGECRMPLSEHFAELRQRLLRCVIFFAAVLIAGMFFYDLLWRAARLPLAYAAIALDKPPENLVPFQWLAPLDGICSLARVDLIIAGLLALPLCLYEAWCFISPGLTERERSIARAAFTAGAGLFICGAAVAFFWAAPLALQWLMAFNRNLAGSFNQWTFDGYLAFLGLIMVGFGLAFEMPLLMYVLGRFGLIHPEQLRRFWRHALLALLVIAAIFTPPEPVSMALLSLLLVMLYGSGYALVLWAQRRRP